MKLVNKERITKFVNKVFPIVSGLLFFPMLVGVVLLLVATVVAPFALIVTAFLMFVCTLATFERRLTAILSMGGIALFLASWPATWTYGTYPGELVWALGVLAWFMAVYKSISPHLVPLRRA